MVKIQSFLRSLSHPRITEIGLNLLIHQALMKPSKWQCIILIKEMENHIFIQHGKESQREYSTKGKMDSSLHHLEIIQGIPIKVNKHEVETSQQQQQKFDQKDHFSARYVEKTTCLKIDHIKERTLQAYITQRNQLQWRILQGKLPEFMQRWTTISRNTLYNMVRTLNSSCLFIAFIQWLLLPPN